MFSSDSCEPIKTVHDLKNSANYGQHWSHLVKPLRKTSDRLFYGKDYFKMDMLGDDTSSELDRPEVLVCHDYKGNYLDDRFIRNETANWDEYRFYSWSGIDIFCYFSHNLVTIPTLQYINAAHLNGVKVMVRSSTVLENECMIFNVNNLKGTIIFEHLEGADNLRAILADEATVDEISDALVDICKRLKFEGWFFNVEVSLDIRFIKLLKYFVGRLSQKIHTNIPHGRVIWYDSITIDGYLKWQNELNEKNEDFFVLCDGIFTNYTWNQTELDRMSHFVSDKYPHKRKNVFVGIDIFGRGQTAKFDTFKVR